MAVNLKMKKKCHIVAPEWLNVGTPSIGLLCLRTNLRLQIISPDYLQDKLAQETTGPSFSSLPFRFTEIAEVILDV